MDHAGVGGRPVQHRSGLGRRQRVTARRALLIRPCPGSRGRGRASRGARPGPGARTLRRGRRNCLDPLCSSRCRRAAGAVVLDGQLHHARDVIVGQVGRQLQRRVDTGQHRGAGQVPAVLHPALRHVCRAQPVEDAVIGPVRGGAVTLQGASGGQQQRAGAYRGDHLGGGVGLAQVVQQDGVHQLPQGGRAAAGHDHDVGLGKLLQRRGGGHPHRGVGGHRVEVFGDHHHVVPRLHAVDAFGDFQTGHHLQRSDQVQRGQTGVHHEGDDLVGRAPAAGFAAISTSTGASGTQEAHGHCRGAAWSA
jgi:hypothetical protein